MFVLDKLQMPLVVCVSSDLVTRQKETCKMSCGSSCVRLKCLPHPCRVLLKLHLCSPVQQQPNCVGVAATRTRAFPPIL